MEGEEVRTTAVIAASRAEVWDAMTEPARLSEWFGAEVIEMDLRPGGRLVFRSRDGSIRRALVESVEPSSRIAFRWLPLEQRSDGALEPIPHTSVELVLEDAGDGTRVSVRETPIGRGALIGR